jgi:hypothetical protein
VELVIEVLQTVVLLSGIMFLYLVMALGLGLPMGTSWFLTFNGHESGSKAIRKFLKEDVIGLLVVMVIFSVIAGAGATLLIYLRQMM